MMRSAGNLLKYLLLLLSLNVFYSACGQSLPRGSRSDSSIFMLNEKTVHLIRHQYGDPDIRFLALHDSEKTGLKAAFKFMAIYGGCAVELKYGQVRNIEFSDSLQKFSFDPNKMFTDEGAYLSLAQLSAPQIHNGLTERIRKLGTELLNFGQVDSLGVILTLHNNYNGGFSVFSYTPGNYLERTAADVYINSGMDPDNFVFVTDRRFFEYLKNREVNVVLQSQDVPDDGSLSVFAMQANIPYSNIEAQHGQVAENYRLILIVSEMLKEIPLQYHLTFKQ
jgi:hypothetical protein